MTESEAQILTQALLRHWRVLLENPGVAASDNVFELGASSLQVSLVSARILDEFGLLLRLKSFLDAQTTIALVDAVRDRPLPGPDPASDDNEDAGCV